MVEMGEKTNRRQRWWMKTNLKIRRLSIAMSCKTS